MKWKWTGLTKSVPPKRSKLQIQFFFKLMLSHLNGISYLSDAHFWGRSTVVQWNSVNLVNSVDTESWRINWETGNSCSLGNWSILQPVPNYPGFTVVHGTQCEESEKVLSALLIASNHQHEEVDPVSTAPHLRLAAAAAGPPGAPTGRLLQGSRRHRALGGADRGPDLAQAKDLRLAAELLPRGASHLPL